MSAQIRPAVAHIQLATSPTASPSAARPAFLWFPHRWSLPVGWISPEAAQIPRCPSGAGEPTARYQTRAKARADIFEYIERGHNPRQRRRVAFQQEGKKLFTHVSVVNWMASALKASVNWRRVGVAMLTSNFIILPLMEVSMKSGEGHDEVGKLMNELISMKIPIERCIQVDPGGAEELTKVKATLLDRLTVQDAAQPKT
jgi:hypothetical protein